MSDVKITDISDDIWARIRGNVYVDRTSSYSVTAYQAVGHTKRFVLVRRVPMKRTSPTTPWGDEEHVVDWEWVDAHSFEEDDSDEKFSLCRTSEGKFVLFKGRGTMRKYMRPVKDRTRKYSTCSY